jgi:ADP-ribose pyrophosphatase
VKEKTISTKTLFQGRLLKLDVVTIDIDGVRATREIVHHGGATAVLAQLPDDRFILVEQYRKPVEKEMLEIVAGVREKGERPDVCARRELKEETGYTPKLLKKLGVMLPSPGYTTEVLHLFYARVDPQQGHKRPDDDERVSVRYLSSASIETLMKRGRIQDGKTLAAWTLYKLKILRAQR